MGLFPRSAEASVKRAQNRSFLDGVTPFSVHPPPSIPAFEDWHTLSLDAALRIPAYKRGVTLISGIIAQLPLVLYKDGERLPPQDVVLDVGQPEKYVNYEWTMQRTVIDLIAYGRAYWEVVKVKSDGAGSDWPYKVEYVPAADVGDNGVNYPTVTIPGRGDVQKSTRAGVGDAGAVVPAAAPPPPLPRRRPRRRRRRPRRAAPGERGRTRGAPRTGPGAASG